MIREDMGLAGAEAPTFEYDPVNLTPVAHEHLAKVMAEKGLTDASLRVFVSGGGCSGLQYGMAFITESEPGDHVFSSQGMKIHVDPVSIDYLHGSTIDYEESLMGGGFRVDNPNAMSSCGCGSSFKPARGEAGASGGCGSGCGCG